MSRPAPATIQMTDINKVIAGAKSIERILVEQFGGQGRGMKEKLDSARYPIAPQLHRRITQLARLRNRCVHEEGFELRDSDEYARKCAAVCEDLRRAHAQAVRLDAARGARRRRFLAVGVLALLGAGWLLGSHVAERLSPREPAPDHDAFAPATMRAQATQPVHTVESGAHIGLGNDVLAVEQVGFGYGKDSAGRPAPRLRLTLRNTSARTLASVALHARLYINGELAPVIDTASGRRSNQVVVGFGDAGLAPGARTTVEPSVFGNAAFDVPDAVQARQRRLVVRVERVTDARGEPVGTAAPGWPAPVYQ